MLATTHLVFGFFVGLLLESIIQPVNLGLYYGIVLLAALLPDIDHEGSVLNRTLRITKILPMFFKHRGLFHSIWPIIILSWLTWSFSRTISLAIIVGYGSHLLIDSTTKMGVNWLYPLKSKLRGPVKTSGMTENVLFIIFVVLDAILIIL